MGQIIGFLSGKGGTGKTTVCAGLATALSADGKKVLCVDCDVGLRNLDISLGMADCGALSFQDVSEGGYSLLSATVHPEFPKLFFLTAPVGRLAEEIDSGKFSEMLEQARTIFDYVLLDAPAGLDAGFRLVSRNADSILLVTGCGPAAIRDAVRVADTLELSGKTDVRLIINRVDAEMMSDIKLNIDDLMDTAGLPLMGIVFEDRKVVLSAAFGYCMLKYSRRSPASKCFCRIARRVQGFREPIPYR